jgi:hypothetical protein
MQIRKSRTPKRQLVDLGRTFLHNPMAAYWNQMLPEKVGNIRLQGFVSPRRDLEDTAFAERLIGSIGRECLAHIIASGEEHLRRNLISYGAYYNSIRTHRSLHKAAPIFRPIQQIGIIRSHPILGGASPSLRPGLGIRYTQQEAATGPALKLMALAAHAICGTKAASQSRNTKCLKKQRRLSCVANTPKPM